MRNVGTHAAGVVITDKPIVEYAPLHRTTNNSEDTPIKSVCQFEMSIVEDQGLLKVDFLGLSTLTVMQRCCDMIEKRHGIKLTIDNIPVDDPETFAFLSKGNTPGVFQLEGGGMTKTLVQLQPKNLRNVIALVALYRPGPMQFIPDYIACARGVKEPTYRHPKMEPIFAETYGIPVYQEQIMNASIQLAGYTPSDSDDLRKAIAKKIKNKVAKHKGKFVEGCVKNGIDQETADGIFSDWEAFASYGFNKSHAADYALVAVQTAFLKCHYTVEYMAALISVYEGSADKVAAYVADCRELGIQVLPPDINKSSWDFTIEDTADGKANIRFGMGAIKNVGHGPAQQVVAAREKEGPFRDLTDFARRVDLKAVGKRALESLIRVGTLDAFGPRRSLLEGMDRIISLSASHIGAAREGQMSFFGISSAFEDTIELPPALEMDQREMLEWERELLGIFISAHPLDAYIGSIRGIISHYSGTLASVPDKRKVIVAGMVTRARPYVTKKNTTMAFATIEDIQGPIELVIFPRAWKKCKELFDEGKVIIVSGTLDKQEADSPKVLVDKVKEATVSSSADGFGFSSYDTVERPYQSESVRMREPVADFLVTEQSMRGGAGMELDDLDMPFELEPPPEPDDWGFETVASFASGGGEILFDESEIVPDHDDDFDDNDDESPEDASVDVQEETVAESSQPITPVPQMAAPLTPSVHEKSEPEKPLVKKSASQAILERVKARQEEKELPDWNDGSVPIHPRSAPPPPREQLDLKTPGFKRKQIDELPPLDDSPKPEDPPQKLVITLKGTDSPDRDRRRLRTVYGELQACPGKDRFCFYVIENGHRYLIEFPNDTTGICTELVTKLKTRLGSENVSVESA